MLRSGPYGVWNERNVRTSAPPSPIVTAAFGTAETLSRMQRRKRKSRRRGRTARQEKGQVCSTSQEKRIAIRAKTSPSEVNFSESSAATAMLRSGFYRLFDGVFTPDPPIVTAVAIGTVATQPPNPRRTRKRANRRKKERAAENGDSSSLLNSTD